MSIVVRDLDRLVMLFDDLDETFLDRRTRPDNRLCVTDGQKSMSSFPFLFSRNTLIYIETFA